MDQAVHRMATQEREKIRRTTKQTVAGNYLEHNSTRQTTLEGIDGRQHPAVDGQRLSEVK